MPSDTRLSGGRQPSRDKGLRHGSPELIELGRIRDSIPFYLRLAQNASFQAFARAVGEIALRPGWYAVLHVIDQNPGLTPTVLSRTTGRDKSTLTPVLTQLEEHGLIIRRRDVRDGRSHGVYLTRGGRAELRTLETHAVRHDRQLDRIVGPSNKRALLQALARIIHALDPKADPTSRRRRA